jgi:nucleoid-associated protein YgaU
VQPGDSLHKIALQLYGQSTKADRIYQLNKQMIGDDPHRLKVGQVLQLPDPPAAQPSPR